MPANTAPIYTGTPDIQWIGGVSGANNTVDLTTGTSYLVFTADATNGGFVRELRIKCNPATTSAATVVRVWINNGVNTTTAANSTLFTELGLPICTTSATVALPDFVIPMNIALPAGYKIYVTLGTGLTDTASVTAIGGKY